MNDSEHRHKRLNELRIKFLKAMPLHELERKAKKCPNKWKWDMYELELARRETIEIVKLFNS